MELGIGCESKREVKDDSSIFGWSNGKDGAVRSKDMQGCKIRGSNLSKLEMPSSHPNTSVR